MPSAVGLLRSLSIQRDFEHCGNVYTIEDKDVIFSENKKSLIKKQDADLMIRKEPHVLKKERRKAILDKCNEKRVDGKKKNKPTEPADNTVDFFPKLEKELTKFLNANYKTKKSGIRCIYLDTDPPEKVVVETSPQEQSTAEKVITEFLSEFYPGDKLNQLVGKKYFEVKKQDIELQYTWNGYKRITVAGQSNGSFCSMGCLVKAEFNTQKKVGDKPITEEKWSQLQFGHLTSAHSISMKMVDGDELSGTINDQMNNQILRFENVPYKSVFGPYSVQDEVNTYKAVDAAVIKMQDQSRHGDQYQFDTLYKGLPNDLNTSPEKIVYKIGSATGKTVGYIDKADLKETLTIPINGQDTDFVCSNVIRIRTATGHPPFSMPGDSGAVVYRYFNGKKQALGLVYRCALEDGGLTHAVYCSNCQDALQELCHIKVKIATDE